MKGLTGRIRKWGNSYGILIPKRELERHKLRANQTVTIDLVASQDFTDLFGSCKFGKSIDELKREIKEGYDHDW